MLVPTRDVELDSRTVAAFLETDHVGTVRTISDIAALSNASEEELAFCIFDDPSRVQASDAGTVICPRQFGIKSDTTLIVHESPRLAFVQVVDEFVRDHPEETEIHPTAVVDDGAQLGDRCIVGANAYIGEGVTIGDDCIIQAGTTIGDLGFGYPRSESGDMTRQIHVGDVVIEDGVEIGANCSIDRAVFEETRIGSGTKINNLVHIAHNVEIGLDVWIGHSCGISGSVFICDRVDIHPHVAITDHVTIGAAAEVGMNAAVLEDLEAGVLAFGTPAKPKSK